MINYNSTDINFANSSMFWYGSDSKEVYTKNLKEKSALLKQYDWIDKSFDYSFNSNGFRCSEFTSDPTIMFLGGSTTCGTGLPVDATWPELVAKSLNMKCANLGQGGGSFDTAFRMCLGYIDKIKPKIVIFLQPGSFRWELISKDSIHFFGIWTIDTTYKAYKNYMQEYMIDENNNYFNTYKNILAIESLCKERQIKFLNFEPTHLVKNDLARDLAHPGIRSNLQFANTVLSKLETQ
jgi:hypothetical protein